MPQSARNNSLPQTLSLAHDNRPPDRYRHLPAQNNPAAALPRSSTLRRCPAESVRTSTRYGNQISPHLQNILVSARPGKPPAAALGHNSRRLAVPVGAAGKAFPQLRSSAWVLFL